MVLNNERENMSKVLTNNSKLTEKLHELYVDFIQISKNKLEEDYKKTINELEISKFKRKEFEKKIQLIDEKILTNNEIIAITDERNKAIKKCEEFYKLYTALKQEKDNGKFGINEMYYKETIIKLQERINTLLLEKEIMGMYEE